MAVAIANDGPSLNSVVNGMQITFAQEYGKTSIFLRVCANSANFQLRSENVGQWMTEVFLRTTAANGCSPSTTSSWRMVYNIDPNTGETFRIYGYASDQPLTDAEFMQRAARTDCKVTAYGVGYCTPANPAPVSVPIISVDQPSLGQATQGDLIIGGWVVDSGSWNGPGINDVHIYVNNQFQGAASYGSSRTDVANAFKDSRFTASGYTYTLNTKNFANGPATIKVMARSTITGQWSSIERSITINNPTIATPLPTQPPSTPPRANDWNVPYYHQGDVLWKNTKIGACNNTIGNVGCALTSLAMVMSFYGVNHNPGTLNSCMGNEACYLNWSGNKFRICSQGKVTWKGWPRFSTLNYAYLEQELRSGPVILELRNASTGNMHFVVVVGGSGSDPANYRVHDPGLRGGKNRTLKDTFQFWFSYNNMKLVPLGFRLYSGTPATAQLNTNMAELAYTPSFQLSATDVISGSADIYDVTDDTVTLALAAESSAGAITDMRIWTESQPNDTWMPYAPYAQVPFDTAIYVQFRDSAGNVSAVIAAQAPIAPDIEEDIYTIGLPLVVR
jgi:hypothetical protein